MRRVFSILWIQCLIVFSVFAQEADIARIFTEQDVSSYSEASASYLEWLKQAADPNVGDPEQLAWHLRWIAMITPEESVVHKSAQSLIGGKGTHGDSETIINWWHRQDPLPATYHNERIEEHLYRVYHAKQHYAARRDSLGVDDRGRIFVRFGRPWRQAAINLEDPRLQVLPLEYRLPRNEIWVYRGIHDDAHYLFVQLSRRRPYRIDTPESLIPPNLRGTRRRVGLLLAWMEDIFGQLAMEHDHYGAIYDAVVNYTTLPTSVPLRPYEFSQWAIQDTRTRDDQHQLRRAKSVPLSVTNVYGNATELTPQLRFSRFLERDGSTRLEAYWGIDVSKLRPSRSMTRRLQQLQQRVSSDFILSVGLTKHGPEFEPQNIQLRRYHLPQGRDSEQRIYSWITRDFSTSPITMQWSLHWTVTDSIPPQPAAAWAIGVTTVDTLEALNGDGISLELSDLKPLRLESTDTFDGAVPYVGREIRPDIPFALYFEAYFLRFNEEDRTRYTVAYSLSSEDVAPITTSFDYEGNAATLREFMVIDIGEWKEPGPLTLTLTVTDQVAGTTKSRSIDFDYKE
ncbi:MAG: GWxTD domain-containing protein [Bacteroidota bacterium]|nr:GWxTD domain-containing protein [Bacteroidota bacterium]MXW13659.1 GWxTD domain-containing protein [Rhodothermaceae bacterium]MXW33345.1 GWxTD domain-containing protein [Rhodothermaceae bacterium]MYC05188.1 GWxTD domain-containing protein [Rhodothermaceae bacterium]MYE63779.1 GWxTD domain-containing protein [Rhodothermaceae bacterium]